jgi:hypothetical protein
MIDPEQLLRQPALQRPSSDLDERIAALASRAALVSGQSNRRQFPGSVVLACAAMAMCIGFLAGRTSVAPVSDAGPVSPAPPTGSEYAAGEVDAPARPLPAEPPRITFPEARPLPALSETSTAASAQPPPHFWVAPDSLPIDLATFEYH